MLALSIAKPATLSLKDKLAAVLPRGSRYRVRYIHSKSRKCEPLFSPLPNGLAEKTTLGSHFLTVSIEQDSKDVLVYAVEVLVYSSARLTTLFVSKADSTGYLPRSSSSVIRPITSTFLAWLSDQQRAKQPWRKQVISLFGRAQGQYLFPGSAENPRKHVLDDRQLIKWWAKALDPLHSREVVNSQRQGYITVPGYRGHELRRFFPDPTSERWKEGHPLHEIAAVRGIPEHAPTRCLLPRFPDDPKARYMLDLDDEVGLAEDAGSSAVTATPTKRKNARWKVIHTLEQFWDGMEFRQECSSGRSVGFLWLVIDGDPQAESQEKTLESQDFSQMSETMRPAKSKVKQHKKRKTGRVICRQARAKGSKGAGRGATNVFDGDGLCLTADGYDQAMQTMLHLDFANIDVAAKSTSKWVMEVASTARLPKHSWLLDVVGESVDVSAGSQKDQQVNDLGSMIRKKKRPLDEGIANQPADAAPVAVNMLAAGLIRKKPKP